MSRLRLVPAKRAQVDAFIRAVHRHHQPTAGDVFRLAACDADQASRVVAVVSVGNPAARLSMDGATLEVRRLASDGTPNACSFLLAAARRVAFDMGYARLLTYTLPDEGGASLRAAGWEYDGEGGGGKWGCTPERSAKVGSKMPSEQDWPTSVKSRWVVHNLRAASAVWPDRQGGDVQESLFAEAAP